MQAERIEQELSDAAEDALIAELRAHVRRLMDAGIRISVIEQEVVGELLRDD